MSSAAREGGAAAVLSRQREDAGATATRSRQPTAGSAAPIGRAATGAIVAVALVGAVLLLVSEFTTLYQVNAANTAGPVKSVSTGSNDSYALIPIALAGAILAISFWRSGSRPALLAIGLLGLVALLITLLGDLPDAHATGLIGSATTQYIDASSTPSAGFYLETLGAVVLIVACVCGFLLIGPPAGAGRLGEVVRRRGGVAKS